MDERLHTAELNLAVLEAIKDYDKLRIVTNDPTSTELIHAPTLQNSHLA